MMFLRHAMSQSHMTQNIFVSYQLVRGSNNAFENVSDVFKMEISRSTTLSQFFQAIALEHPDKVKSAALNIVQDADELPLDDVLLIDVISKISGRPLLVLLPSIQVGKASPVNSSSDFKTPIARSAAQQMDDIFSSQVSQAVATSAGRHKVIKNTCGPLPKRLATNVYEYPAVPISPVMFCQPVNKFVKELSKPVPPDIVDAPQYRALLSKLGALSYEESIEEPEEKWNEAVLSLLQEILPLLVKKEFYFKVATILLFRSP